MSDIVIGTDFNAEGYKWDHGVITWSIATTNYSNQGGETFYNAFNTSDSVLMNDLRNAINQWDNASPYLTFQEVPDSPDVNVRIGWGYNVPGSGNPLGVTYSFHNGATFTQALVMVDYADNWALNGNEGFPAGGTRTDEPLLHVLLHELGHAVGLDHYDLNPAVMNSTANSIVTLTSHETDGLNYYLYPSGTPGNGTPDYTAAITSVSATSGSAGQTITVNIRISNQGQRGDGPAWKLFLSQDETISPINEVVDPAVANGLVLEPMDGGSSFNWSTSFVVPSGISGTWHLGLVVYPENFIAETNNNNNVSSLTAFNITGGGGSSGGNGPDLQVVPGSVSYSTTNWVVGQSVTVSYTMKNYGNQTASGTGNLLNYVVVSPDSNFNIAGGDAGVAVESHQIPSSLTAGQSFNGSFTFTVDTGNTVFKNGAGTYYAGVLVDGAKGVGTINETNESNNFSQATQIHLSVPTTVAGSVSINDVTVTEGDSGSTIATFTVTRTGGTAAFSVNYATANNTAISNSSSGGASNISPGSTATSNSDYVGASGTLSFGNGVNTQSISVTINGDKTNESSETFFVNLSNATNGASIVDSQGIGTISNDDASVGDNTYVVNNPGDVIVEKLNEGDDVVYASVDYTLPANVESVVLVGAANLSAAGNGQDNALIGNSGNNALDGKGGADYMVGGAGNDIYYVDNAGDRAVEKAGEGSDTVYASIDYTIGTNVEAVVLTGSANLNAAGNDQVNALIGNSGNNNLDGHGGDDYMVGGAGNDIYFVDSSSDVVVENANEGADIVYASIDYTIGANVESVVLTGSANLNAAGGNTGNALIGNSGNNALDGRGGGDYLVGNGGNDTFVFSALQANGDIVADFDGHGASAGDSLRFIGYGSAAQGAAFTQIDGTHWQIHSGIDGHNETLMLQNGASVHASDYSFV